MIQKLTSWLARLSWKEYRPILIALPVFVLLTLAYVSPVLEGRRLLQPDIVNWQGMSKEIADHREAYGEEPLWTNSMFGGMPAFQISVHHPGNLARLLHSVITLGLPSPADMIFLYFLGFFIFLLLLRLNPWVALAGAVAFAFSSYHFIIIEAGHNTKAIAIGYMAPVLGAVVYTFKRQMLAGALLFALFMGLQLMANHYQITYYLGFIVLFYGIFELANHWKEKQLPGFFRKLGLLTAALLLAIGMNFGNFWSTYAYTSETMRGGSELSLQEEASERGLSKEYITHWSYGIGESFSLLIPNAKGGGTGPLAAHPRALEKLEPDMRDMIGRENRYWGDQPFTSGPVYVGSVVLFLFILSLFLTRGPLKEALLLAILLGLLLSWGRNFMPLTSFFIDYIPGYDKFRAVSMTLVIVELCIPALAFIGLHRLYKNPDLLNIRHPALLTAFGLTAGLALLFYLAPRLFFDFFSQAESRAFADFQANEPALASQMNRYMHALEQARVALFRADALRSFLFVTVGAGLVWLLIRKKIGGPLFAGLMALLITADMWPVNRRYLNNDDFVPRRRAERPFPLRTADQYILQDTDQFRVLDMTESTFNSARTSFYHHSIGGYHGAKLQRYQDLIDLHLGREMAGIDALLNSHEEAGPIQEGLKDKGVLNMLNTRYIIYHPDAPPLANPHALGNAWLVHSFRLVEDADEEILGLNQFDPSVEALIDRRFADHLQGKTLEADPHARIELLHYRPNHLQYAYEAASDQLAVFSEIFYADGWQVTVNGEAADHFRVNYVLRGMVLPAGSYQVEFRFEPRSFRAGARIAYLSSMLFILAALAWAWRTYRERVNP